MKARMELSHGRGSHTPPRDKGQMARHLKCLCTNPCRLGNKPEETELHRSHIVTMPLEFHKVGGKAHVMGVLQGPGTGPPERQKGQKRMKRCALCRKAV